MEKRRVGKIDDLFITALNNNVFSGAGFAFSKWSKRRYDRSVNYYGYAQREPEKKRLSREHFFDLASLTKPLATVPVLLALFEKKSISPETQLSEIYPSCPSDKKNITIRQLMSHNAGFVPHREYFHELIKIPIQERKTFLLQKLFAENLIKIPGESHNYSDLGYILLGLIIEKITDKNLGELASNLIYGPSGLQNDLVFPGLNKKGDRHYVSTEKCLWSGKMLSGTVHDDNCRVVGGVAGHAGLFGTVEGVVAFCEQLLDQWKGRGCHPAYSSTLLRRILTRIDGSAWTLGFDTVSEKGSSSGNYFSKESVGHLGFTGTSFWIDPEKECIVVLLTNRVHPSRENWKIKEFRPVFHDALMEGRVF
ncbi:MAG: beta-lactamase family protein [Desulfocapsa sp.]|nr:beta-lactamase family protein [Desulfocapsa sp.]